MDVISSDRKTVGKVDHLDGPDKIHACGRPVDDKELCPFGRIGSTRDETRLAWLGPVTSAPVLLRCTCWSTCLGRQNGGGHHDRTGQQRARAWF
ncbi:DUF2171 domain-containing protein [Bradyrhizobium genosp. P]|uniref:DUF2171 domain-containing protein n=1 Tax=Bradyrhizobium genosp. P TaxID=83641 RepID=UPI003CE6DFC9